MSIPTPFSVTVEDAVARMVNMDYIPAGFTLTDMTAAFLEDAEAEYHNAKIDHLPLIQIEALKIRIDACKARQSLTQFLLDALRNEIKNPDGLIIVTNDDPGIEQHITFDSLTNWASSYGIGSLGRAYSDSGTDKTDAPAKKISWEDVTIKIYADYRIAYFSDLTGPKGGVMRFQDIGLMGIRKNEPNNLGGILIGLSAKKKFPIGESPANRYAAAISKLRNSLKQLTGLSDDPFYFNKADGYKPRFKLVDDRRNADERVKGKAQYMSIDDTKDFYNENLDAADADNDDWLAKHS